MNRSEKFTADGSSYSNDALTKGYGKEDQSFEKTEEFKGFQGYYDNSGFERYEDYKGPDPFYRGFEGNTGYNPTPAKTRPGVGDIPDQAPFMPDYSQLHTKPGDAFYKGYDAPAPMKYRPGMEQEYAEPVIPSVPAAYEMPFYHFAAVSHLWSAGALFMMFVISSGISLCPRLFPMNADGFYIRLTLSAVFIALYILSGIIARKMTQKASDDVLCFFLLLYGGVSGICVSIPLKCIFGDMMGLLSYSYLVGAAAIAVLSVISLIIRYDILNIPATLLALWLACMAEFAVCHYLGIPIGDRLWMIVMTSVILGFAAFETMTVKRTFDEYIADDNTMKRNMIIAAIGHYVSFATLIFNAIKGFGQFIVRMIPVLVKLVGGRNL